MKFYQFLNEERTQQITEEQFNTLYDKHCSHFHSNGGEIYRGLQTILKYGFIDPTKFTRRSANTKNYYTILFDELLPSWNGWPNRSKSIICASDMEITAGYGEPFNVYPYNNSKIGVCSQDDIWLSFEKGFDYGLDDFNTSLNYISMYANQKELKETKQGIVELCKTIDEMNDNDELDKMIESLKKLSDYVSVKLIEKYLKYRNKHFIDFLDIMFNPIKNGFKMYK